MIKKYLINLYSKFRFNKNDLILYILWLFTTFVENYTLDYVFYFVIGFICIYRLFDKFKLFQPGLLLIIFISTYLIYLIPVFFFDVQIAGHVEYVNKDLYIKTLKLFIFFLVIFNLFLNRVLFSNHFIIKKNLKCVNSSSLFFLFFTIQLFILFYGMSIGSAIIGQEDSYEAYRNNLTSQNGLWEYFYIVYILSYLFSSRKKVTNYLLYF